jgi:hypothetical protein
MSYRIHPKARADLLGRALLARIDRIPVNEARREEASLHFAHAEALSERLFRWVARLRPARSAHPASAPFAYARRPLSPTRQSR